MKFEQTLKGNAQPPDKQLFRCDGAPHAGAQAGPRARGEGLTLLPRDLPIAATFKGRGTV